LSLPALTGCISAGGAAAVAAPTGVSIYHPGTTNVGITIHGVHPETGPFAVEVDHRGVFSMPDEALPDLRINASGAQSGGGDATSFEWQCAIIQGDAGGANSVGQGVDTNENTTDTLVIIVQDLISTSPSFEIGYSRINSGGSGVATPIEIQIAAS
jgi:hypothetical protein